MAPPMQTLDDMIREYLIFRGFVTTFKSFEADLKAEKEKGYKADK